MFTKAELAAAPGAEGAARHWSLLQRAKASFDPERSGDFIVLLKPRVTPIFNTSGGYVATHGSPWDYDRKVPILFWRKGMRPFEQSLAVETADILPTLAATVGVPIPPGTIDGRCLDLDEGPGTTCRLDSEAPPCRGSGLGEWAAAAAAGSRSLPASASTCSASSSQRCSASSRSARASSIAAVSASKSFGSRA